MSGRLQVLGADHLRPQSPHTVLMQQRDLASRRVSAEEIDRFLKGTLTTSFGVFPPYCQT